MQVLSTRSFQDETACIRGLFLKFLTKGHRFQQLGKLTQPRRETDTSCPQWKFQNSNFIIFAWNLVWLNTIEEEIFLFPGCGKGEKEVENLQLILTILFYRLWILRLFQRLFLVNSQENQQKFKFSFPLSAARNW